MWWLCNSRVTVSSKCCHPGLPVKLEWSSVVQSTQEQHKTRCISQIHLPGPRTGFWWVTPFPFVSTSLWGQSHQRPFFTISKTSASRGQHSMTTVPRSTMLAAFITRPNLRQVGCIFKLSQLLRPPGKERDCDGPCCLAGGGLRSTGGFEATVPTEKNLCFSLPHHPREGTQRGLSFKTLYWSSSGQVISAPSLKGSLF